MFTELRPLFLRFDIFMFSGGSRAIFDVRFHLAFTKGKEGTEFYELTLQCGRGPKLAGLSFIRNHYCKTSKEF